MKCEMANSNSSTGFDARLHFIFCGILFPLWRVNSVKNAKGLFIILDLILNQKRPKSISVKAERKKKQFALCDLSI